MDLGLLDFLTAIFLILCIKSSLTLSIANNKVLDLIVSKIYALFLILF